MTTDISVTCLPIPAMVTLDVAGPATVGKDQGEETSAQVGFSFSF